MICHVIAANGPEKKGLQLFKRIPKETLSCFAVGVSYENNLGANVLVDKSKGPLIWKFILRYPEHNSFISSNSVCYPSNAPFSTIAAESVGFLPNLAHIFFWRNH